MGDYKRDSEQDNSMDCPIWGTDDISDEELLKEFEAVKNMDVPLPIPSPSPDEFEKIWARIQEERAESKNVPESDQPEHPKVIKPRFGWKRLAAVGLIACLVAGSGCMVAMGTKSYFYREKELGDGQGIFVNDSFKAEVNGEDEAYKVIESELGIKVLKLGYIPPDMDFLGLYIENGIAYMKFHLDGENIFLIQFKYDKRVSFKYEGDYQSVQKVKNKWLSKELEIYQEELSSGKLRYETSMVLDGTYYRLSGAIQIDEFTQIIERLIY